jgi:hypothetical protein
MTLATKIGLDWNPSRVSKMTMGNAYFLWSTYSTLHNGGNAKPAKGRFLAYNLHHIHLDDTVCE